jgi:hypothetical protein
MFTGMRRKCIFLCFALYLSNVFPKYDLCYKHKQQQTLMLVTILSSSLLLSSSPSYLSLPVVRNTSSSVPPYLHSPLTRDVPEMIHFIRLSDSLISEWIQPG